MIVSPPHASNSSFISNRMDTWRVGWHTRPGLTAMRVERHFADEDITDQLLRLLVQRGAPEHIRSDNGSEFTVTTMREWLARTDVKTIFIEPASLWENGYIEYFNGQLRDELLNRGIFATLTEARVLIADWERYCNQVRTHSALGYEPPAPKAKMLETPTLWVVPLLGACQL